MDLFTLSATLGLDVSSFTSGLSAAEGALGAFGGVGGAVAKGALNLASTVLPKIGGMVLDFGKDVFKTGMETEKSYAAVRAVLGEMEGTETNMQRLRELGLEQARNSIFTAKETGDAYYYMGMAGWKTEQMLAGLPGVMALAAASGEDLGRVSDIVTDSITAFGLTADDVSWYVDILAQTATNANTDVRRMGETFKYIAPIAGSLGADVDDVALSIGLLASAGIKGSMAGTSLRNIFTRLSTNAGQTNKDLGALTILTEKLGVAFWDSSGKMRDWTTIVKEARESWKGLSQEQQVYYAKQIGSQRGMAAWMTLMNATDEEIQKLEKSYENAGGAAQKMADVRLDSLEGDLVRLNSAFDVLKVSIFDDIEGPARELVQWATEALNRITDAVNENGLAGGIKQVAVELKKAGDDLAPIFESIGEMFAPAVSSLISSLTEDGSAIMESARKLGAALAKGALDGAAGELIGGNSKTGQIVGGIMKLFGSDPNARGSTTQKSSSGTRQGGGGGSFANEVFTGIGTGKVTINSLPVEQNALDKLNSDIIKGTKGTGTKVGEQIGKEFDPISAKIAYMTGSRLETSAKTASAAASMDLEDKYSSATEKIKAFFAQSISSAGVTGSSNASQSVIRFLTDAGTRISERLKSNLTSAGSDGGEKMSRNVVNAMENKYNTIHSGLGGTFGSAGKSGGKTAANNINDQIENKRKGLKNTLASVLGESGDPAGNDIVKRIRSVLSFATFTISVVGAITGLFNNGKKFAKAMSGGRILQGATVFGVDNSGAPLVGGEAGPEAIIGTNSLSRLIKDAVNDSAGSSDNITFNIYQQPNQDPEELADVIERMLVRRERQRKAAYSV